MGRTGRLHPAQGGKRPLRGPLLKRRRCRRDLRGRRDSRDSRNPSGRRGILILLLLFVFSLQGTTAQELSETDPLPYEENEFPGWAHDLRRFEVIMFGAFPLTYMLSSLTFEISKASSGGNGSRFSLYSEKSQSDLQMLLITSASISLGIAVADLIIGKVKEKKKEKEERGYSYARPGQYSE